jgi:Recombinase
MLDMAETLNFGEAVQRAGVSRQRLNQAINSGRLPAARGGGPGKPTTIQLEDLQAWCLSEGLALPVETSERLERLPPAAMMERLERLDEMFAGMQRLEHLVEQVLERLERSERTEHSTPAPRLPTAKAAVLKRLRAMQAEGLSLQAIANRLNNDGVPTLSGKGRWQKGTIGNLLAQVKEPKD